MKKAHLLAAAMLVLASSPAFVQQAGAQTFVRAFTSTATDIPAPSTDGTATGPTAAWATVNHMVVAAGVDTDSDGNQEIIVFRMDTQAATVTTGDLASIWIYERTTGDNGYALKYTDTVTQFDGGNFNEFGHMVVADLDNANGPEIIVVPSDRFRTSGLLNTFVVYASSGNDTWGSAATAANNEFSQSVLVGPAGTNVSTDTTTNNEQQGAAAGDFDGDGTTELAIAIDRTNETLIVGVTSGTWVAGNAVVADETAGGLAGLGGSPQSVLAADLNADGRPEVVTGYYNSVGVGIWEGTAANTYAVGKDLSPGAAPADRLPKPGALDSGNFNGDSVRTLYIANGRTGDIYSIDGVASGAVSTMGSTWSTFVTGATLGATDAGTDSNGELLVGQDLEVGDSDGDGTRELIYAYQPAAATSTASQILVWEYNGSGDDKLATSFTLRGGATSGLTSTETIFAVDASTPAGASLDLDGDGRAEIVAATAGVTEPALIVFEVAPTSVNEWYLH